MNLSLFAVAALFLVCETYNIAIFLPATFANSQIIFSRRVGEVLSKAGHNVTIFMIHHFEFEYQKFESEEPIHVVDVNSSTGRNATEFLNLQTDMTYKNLPMWDTKMREAMTRQAEVYKTCGMIASNTSLHNLIIDSKFDIAFTHMFDICAVGLIHVTKIPTWIWLSSGVLMENMAHAISVPVPPSYCPPVMMDAGERMNVWERIKSFVGHIVSRIGYRKMVAGPETAAFREHFGQDFPDLADLAAKAPLVMVNTHELYDFARPTLHKIINIGGVGMKKEDAKNLMGEFARRTEQAKDGVILFSFGSIAPVYNMPDSWKDAFYGAFTEFPAIQFFIRHEYPEQLDGVISSNVYASKWLPQIDLIHHPKTIGLITHGGYNSVQDVIHAGKPVITTGLWGDQLRNSQLVEKLGIGINMRKDDVRRVNVVKNIRRLIEDKSLQEKALRLRDMVATKPISAEALLVKWTEFLAQHKSLDNLVPAGADMNIFVYHSIDVILFLSSIFFILLFIVFCILRFCWRMGCRCIGNICQTLNGVSAKEEANKEKKTQ